MRVLDEELARPSMQVERALAAAGCGRVAGLDEVGRGALAGPVVAAAVVLPLRWPDLADCLHGVRDSKLMTPRQRELWAAEVTSLALAVGVGAATAAEVDAAGLIPATRAAMQRALEALGVAPEHLLLDYMLLPEEVHPQTSFVRGESKALSIAAASVIAKVWRDRQMAAFDTQYPGYGFARHKGYGTPGHLAALGRLGPSPIHRRSYAPVARCEG